MGKATATAATPFPAGNAYTPHPLSSLVPGQMDEMEFNALCMSMKADGQRNAIILYEGKILDGNHRYRACTKLNIAAKFVPFEGIAADAAALVLDNNLHRRQLTSMQKAMVAARMHIESLNAKSGKYDLTQKEMADKVGCGINTVNVAVKLLGTGNTPLIHRAENGDATRGEVSEMIYEAKDSHTSAPVGTMDLPEDDEDESSDSEQPLGTGAQVIPIHGGTGKIVGKQAHPERKATETPAGHAVKVFKALSATEQKHFVEMAWPVLKSALDAAGKLAGATAPAAAPVAPKGSSKSDKAQLEAVAKTLRAAAKPHKLNPTAKGRAAKAKAKAAAPA